MVVGIGLGVGALGLSAVRGNDANSNLGGVGDSSRVRDFNCWLQLLGVAILDCEHPGMDAWGVLHGSDEGLEGGNDGQPDTSIAVAPGPDAVLRALGVSLGLPVALGTYAGPAAGAEPDGAEPEPSNTADAADAEQRAQPDVAGDSAEQAVADVVIRSYDWDDATAIRVFTCESGLREDAVSYDGTSYGITQIHAPTWAPVFPDFWQRWMEAAWNIEHAYIIWLRSGWVAWACW